MSGRIFKRQTRPSHVSLSNALQSKLPDTFGNRGVGAESLWNFKTQFLESRDLTREEPYRSTTKRRRSTTSETDLLRAKRVRLSQTEAQPRAEDRRVEQATEAILQQPIPQHPYTSFLRDFIDPIDTDPRPQSIHTSVYSWLTSCELPRSRSDSYLRNEPIARNFTRSVPEMNYLQDADGYTIPQTPVSIAPSDSTGSGRRAALVESHGYRDFNLAQNGIYMRSSREKLPEHITNLVDHVRKDRQSPGPSRDEVWKDTALEALGDGATEAQVEKYFGNRVFPDYDPPDVLVRAERQNMFKHVTPQQRSNHRISTPAPDLVYGYRNREAFPEQQLQLSSMESQLWVNSQRLIYPFLVIEFKGDCGSMWVAANQCIGGSTSCVELVERLNRQLLNCQSDDVKPIDSTAFSIAMNGTQAHLYISWKQNELDYYTQEFDSFLLQKPEQYLEFRKHVRNIVDWGKDSRLKEIQCSLDTLLEESRKRASRVVKSRPPPSSSSNTSGRKRDKRPSLNQSNSRSSSVQGQNSGQ